MNNVNKFYDYQELRKKYNKTRLSNYPRLDDLWFKVKLFRKMNNMYFSRTPESDSLYRRRNRLVIMVLSGAFYYKTSNNIFNRIEFDILTNNKGIIKKLVNLYLY